MEVTNVRGTNQYQTKESVISKLVRGVKFTLIMLLILTAAGGVIYARVNQYVGEKEKEILESKVSQLEGELETLKGTSK